MQLEQYTCFSLFILRRNIQEELADCFTSSKWEAQVQAGLGFLRQYLNDL
jgi:hypothetical protein